MGNKPPREETEEERREREKEYECDKYNSARKQERYHLEAARAGPLNTILNVTCEDDKRCRYIYDEETKRKVGEILFKHYPGNRFLQARYKKIIKEEIGNVNKDFYEATTKLEKDQYEWEKSRFPFDKEWMFEKLIDNTIVLAHIEKNSNTYRYSGSPLSVIHCAYFSLMNRLSNIYGHDFIKTELGISLDYSDNCNLPCCNIQRTMAKIIYCAQNNIEFSNAEEERLLKQAKPDRDNMPQTYWNDFIQNSKIEKLECIGPVTSNLHYQQWFESKNKPPDAMIYIVEFSYISCDREPYNIMYNHSGGSQMAHFGPICVIIKIRPHTPKISLNDLRIYVGKLVERIKDQLEPKKEEYLQRKEQERLLKQAKQAKNNPLPVIQENSTGLECPVCFAQNANYVNVKCGHLMCCTDCMNAIRNHGKCPKCRTELTQTLKIYV